MYRLTPHPFRRLRQRPAEPWCLSCGRSPWRLLFPEIVQKHPCSEIQPPSKRRRRSPRWSSWGKYPTPLFFLPCCTLLLEDLSLPAQLPLRQSPCLRLPFRAKERLVPDPSAAREMDDQSNDHHNEQQMDQPARHVEC